MSQYQDSDQKPAPQGKHLTPAQIGSGVGAAAAVIAFLVWRDFSPNRTGGIERTTYLFSMVIGGMGALVGLAIGTLIGKLRSAGPASESNETPMNGVVTGTSPSGLGGFFAILSVLCVPVFGFGLLVGIASLVLNRNTRGWPWFLSIVGSILSAIVTVGVAVVLFIVKPNKP